jgi:hypothetical protein
LDEITALVNNNPKLDERYKMLLRHDIPEGSGTNVPIQTDAASIEINGGKDGIKVKSRIKILFLKYYIFFQMSKILRAVC